METKYFEKKMNMILDIMGLMVLHQHDSSMINKHKHDLNIILKEIAKDQRHACTEAVMKFGEIGEKATVESIHNAIMNTHINKEG